MDKQEKENKPVQVASGLNDGLGAFRGSWSEPRNGRRFRISGLSGGSLKYGPCEHCGKTVYSTFRLVVEVLRDDRTGSWWKRDLDIFGHKECLDQMVRGYGAPNFQLGDLTNPPNQTSFSRQAMCIQPKP